MGLISPLWKTICLLTSLEQECGLKETWCFRIIPFFRLTKIFTWNEFAHFERHKVDVERIVIHGHYFRIVVQYVFIHGQIESFLQVKINIWPEI